MDFRVFVSKDKNDAFGYYSDEKNIAYIQANESVPAFNIAIVCRTPGSNGRHLMIEPDGGTVPLDGLTAEYLRQGFRDYPKHFCAEDREMMPHTQFSSLDEFLRLYDPILSEVW